MLVRRSGEARRSPRWLVREIRIAVAVAVVSHGGPTAGRLLRLERWTVNRDHWRMVEIVSSTSDR